MPAIFPISCAASTTYRAKICSSTAAETYGRSAQAVRIAAMRGGDHLHPAADTRGGGGDLFAGYELVRDEHVRAQRADGGDKRVLLARIADDVGKRPDVQRKIPVRRADLVAFVVDEHVSDRPAAEQPREIAQDRRLAAPGGDRMRTLRSLSARQARKISSPQPITSCGTRILTDVTS